MPEVGDYDTQAYHPHKKDDIKDLAKKNIEKLEKMDEETQEKI